MTPGPTLVYECPKCEKTVRRESLRSGNTVGSTLFSDGKRIAPMLPKFPSIVKCKECNTFFWLNDENIVGIGHSKNANMAEFLSSDEYFEAIKSKIYCNKDEEWYLRLNLWWAFNDRTREGKDIFLTEDDKDVYESNCVALIEMLDKNKRNEKIIIAELYRNLGKYVECNSILDTIEEEKYARFKEISKKECEKNNRNVVEILEEEKEKEKIVMCPMAVYDELRRKIMKNRRRKYWGNKKRNMLKFLGKLWRFGRRRG